MKLMIFLTLLIFLIHAGSVGAQDSTTPPGPMNPITKVLKGLGDLFRNINGSIATLFTALQTIITFLPNIFSQELGELGGIFEKVLAEIRDRLAQIPGF